MMGTALTTLLILAVVGLLAAPLVIALLLRRGQTAATMRRMCGACGYDVEESLGTSARCSECGGVLAVVGLATPQRRHAMRLAIIITVIGITVLLIAAILTGTAAFSAATQRRAALERTRAAEQILRLRVQAAQAAQAARDLRAQSAAFEVRSSTDHADVEPAPSDRESGTVPETAERLGQGAD